MNSAVFSTLDSLIAERPPAVRPAPTSPPTSACDEEVGRPRRQDRKFHVRAPIRAANTSAGPRYPAVTVCPTVLATAVPTKKNATKFHPAAHSTAQRGRRTRVATMVAMEFALSWNPLV